MNESTNGEHSRAIDVRRNAGIVRSPLDEIKAIQTLLADVHKDAGDGRTLFRELVQNADDSGARRLRLTVLECGWPDAQNSLLRGPALLVANDGPFPDPIVRLYTGLLADRKRAMSTRSVRSALG